jgi:hypothetical protein
MDELDLVRSAGDNVGPSAEVVARHRAQLDRALAASSRRSGRQEHADAHLDGARSKRERLGHGSASRLGHNLRLAVDLRAHDHDLAAADLTDDVARQVQLGSARREPRPRRRPGWLAIAAVVLAVGGAAATLVLVHGGEQGQITAATEPSTAPTQPQLVCPGLAPVSASSGFGGGAEDGRPAPVVLPVTVSLPPGFDGPADGPSPGMSAPWAGGQLVQHWTSPTGSVELRWPSDRAGAFAEGLPGHSGTANATWTLRGTQTVGQPEEVIVAYLADESPPCNVLDVIVRSDDRGAVTALAADIEAGLFAEDRPTLVIRSEDAPGLPGADGCRGGTRIPNQGGPVELPPQPTARDALRAFLDQHESLATGGYIETGLPDGSIAYRYEPEPGFVATVIHVAERDGGWSAIAWDAAGC